MIVHPDHRSDLALLIPPRGGEENELACSNPGPAYRRAHRPRAALLATFLNCCWPWPGAASFCVACSLHGLSAMVALGLNSTTGVGGLTSFGQAAFVGLGAYTSALFTTSQGCPAGAAGTSRRVCRSSPNGAHRAGGDHPQTGDAQAVSHFLPLGDGLGHQPVLPVRQHAGSSAAGMSGIPPVQPQQTDSTTGITTTSCGAFLLVALYHPQPAGFPRGNRAIRALQGA